MILKEAGKMETNEIKSETVCNSKRRVSFADTTSIKEFLVLRDANTEWNCTYEEPVIYESSSSSINSTNATLLVNKQGGIEQEEEENSKIVVDSSSKSQDESFSKFLSGFLEINSGSRKSENHLNEKNCEYNMELTCHTEINNFNKFDAASIDNVKDESKNLDLSLSQLYKDKTLFVQKSLEITCHHNQPFDSLDQLSNHCSFNNSDSIYNSGLKDSCRYFDDDDASENINFYGKTIDTPALKITADAHFVEVKTSKPIPDLSDNGGSESFKRNDIDMDLTAAVNFHCTENFVTKVNNENPNNLKNLRVLNSSFIENKKSLFQENDQNSFTPETTLDDSVFYSNTVEEKPYKAFERENSIANVDDVGDILKNSKILDFERESQELECEIKKIDPMEDILYTQSIDKTSFISKLNENSEFPLSLVEDDKNQDLTQCSNFSLLNNSLLEISKVNENSLSRLTEQKIMENMGSEKAEAMLDDSSANCITMFEKLNKITKENLPSDNAPFMDELCLIKEFHNFKENSFHSSKPTLNGKGHHQENCALENEKSDCLFQQKHKVDQSLSNMFLNKIPSMNSEDKNKNLSVIYSENKNLPSKILECSKDECLQFCHSEKRFEQQMINQLPLIPDSKIRFVDTINRDCTDAENSNLKTKFVSSTEDVSNIITSKLDEHQNMLTVSSEKMCDFQNVSSVTSSCKSFSCNEMAKYLPYCHTSLNKTSNLAKNTTETNDGLHSFSRSSSEFLEEIAVDLMDCETVEYSHPFINCIDNESERDTSLLNITGKVHNHENEQTLETGRKCKLDVKTKKFKVQEEENQYLCKTRNEFRNGESDSIVENLHPFQKVIKKEISLQLSVEEGKILDCEQCGRYKFSRNLGMFNVESLRNDVVCVYVEKPHLKIKLYVTPQENHLFICGINLETQMQNILPKGFSFASKGLDHYFQQLRNGIISRRLCQVENLFTKFFQSYQQILILLKDIYSVKSCFPFFTKNDYLQIIVMNARKHVLVNLDVQIGFHSTQDIFNPYFSVEANVKVGNLRKKIIEEALKTAISIENPKLLNIIKAIYHKISNIM
ncbi:UNVERIFIED_CONTAM: hypothetical protein RMT77_004551 [Armadillidium vulgare]